MLRRRVLARCALLASVSLAVSGMHAAPSSSPSSSDRVGPGMAASPAVAAAGANAIFPLAGDVTRSTLPAQGYPYYPYDGTWRFVRIWTNGGGGGIRGYGRRRGGGSGWAHDYPDADIHFSTILRELTKVPTRQLPMGGNVLTFDDPRLTQYPIAYVSEPDEWRVTEREAEGLRAYLLKGGFVIFDDFFVSEMNNLVYQMSYVFPELSFLRLDGSEAIFDSFFRLVPQDIYLTGPNKTGTPQFYGLYVDNDKDKRMLAIANAGADVGDLWEWSAEGWYPVDPTNEAFRIGINYIIYSLTH